jgi:hypothetical protein
MDTIHRLKLFFVNLTSNNHDNDHYHNHYHDNDNDRNMIVYKNDKINNLNECIICLEDMKYNEHLILVKCSHIYHRECLEKWIVRRSVCPLCSIEI